MEEQFGYTYVYSNHARLKGIGPIAIFRYTDDAFSFMCKEPMNLYAYDQQGIILTVQGLDKVGFSSRVVGGPQE